MVVHRRKPSARVRSNVRNPFRTKLLLESLERRDLFSTSPFGSLVQVTGLTPFTNTSDINGQSGTVYLNSEVEPNLAVDPRNPLHLVGAWQQDRWSNGGSRGIVAGVSTDGGNTWTLTPLPGDTVNSGGTALRASDPWVSIGPDGTIYASYLEDNDPNVTNPLGVFVSTSTDGGFTWNNPVPVIQSTDNNFFNDKESITANPATPGEAYVVWDRLDFVNNLGPALFSKTTDGGHTWSTPQTIANPTYGQTLGNQIVVLPNGTLVDVTALYDYSNNSAQNAVIRSTDDGATWSAPIVISGLESVGVTDPDTGATVRSGEDSFPTIAVDHTSGNLYVSWQDGRFSGFTHDDVALSMSTDGGLTWSDPVKVNQTPAGLTTGDEQAYTPAVAVAANGTVAVSYYDFRNNTPDPGALTDAWLVYSTPSNPLSFGHETRLTDNSFDLEAAPNANGEFIGDYEGLVAGGSSFNTFGTFFAQTVSTSDPSSIFFRGAGLVSASGDLTPPLATEGQALSSVTVFHFSDTNSSATAADFVATVNTGDATLTSNGNPSNVQVVADPSGGFDVQLSYTYAEELTGQPFRVSVTDAGGLTTSQSVSNFSVADAAVTASGVSTITAPFGSSIGGSSTPLATFIDPGGAEANDGTHYSATINWGDTSATAAGTISYAGSPGSTSSSFTVTGPTHSYSAVGTYTITVTVNHEGVISTATTNVIVNAANTTTQLTVTSATTPNAAFTYGNILTFQATVTANAPSTATVNTGSVSFYDGANLLGTVNVNASGVASFSTTVAHPLSAGGHTITAVYNDGSSFNTSNASQGVNITPAPLWITANSTSKAEGNTLTFTGTQFTIAGPAGSRTVAGATGPILFDGDSVTSVTLSSAGAGATSEDGSYAITVSNAQGSGLSNYAITYVPGTLTVLEPAINATMTAPAAINEGDASALVEVATFTHANGVEAASHFSATVDWGVAGHHADPGTITQDSNGTYHVMAARPVFTEQGSFNLSVNIRDNDTGANIGQNFAGLTANDDIALYGSFFIPPDQGSAVGPNYYMEVINLAYAIYHKDGTVAVPRTALSTFFANAGIPGLGNNLSDTRVIYDQGSGHWFVVAITTNSNSNSIVLAVSQTSDPTGAWKAASFVANTTANNFADYPTIGVDANALYIASNNFLNLSSFDGVSLTSIPKADLLNPAGPVVANRTHYENITGGGTSGTQPFTFAPVSAFDGRNHGVILATDGFSPATVIHRYTVSNPGSNAALLSADNPITVPTYWDNQEGHQPDGSQTLSPVDFRFGSDNVYQVGNDIWVADSVLPTSATGPSAYDAIRWYEIDETTNTVVQSGTISDPHHDYLFPSIAANAAGDVVIGFTATGDSTTSDYPGSWYVAGTTAGGVTTFGTPTVLRNGSSNYNISASGENRFGDFSAISVDPTNPNAFWIAEETVVPGNPANTTRTQVWGTQMSEIVFGNTAGVSGSLAVNEPAINAVSAALSAIVIGQPSATVEVATFTHANGVEPIGDFTATINWGIAGHTADSATITQDSSGTYHVTGNRPVYSDPGNYTVTVNISEDNVSTSVSDSQEIDDASTSTSVSSSLNPSTYGQSETFTATVTNISSGVTPTGSVEFFDGSTDLGAGTFGASSGNQSTWTLTISTLTAGGHTISADYSNATDFNSSSGSVSQTVNKANAHITVTGYSVTYDGNSHTATGSATGVFGESLSGLDLSGTTHTNAGSYTDSWTFTDTTGNYNNASGMVNDSIAKANATITVTGYSVTYDGNAHTATGSATGVKGESLAGLDLSATTHTNAASYTDSWTFTDQTGNYNNTSSTVSDSVAKANATISVTPYSVTYDGNPHTASGSATGVKGESLAGLDLSGTTHTNAGTYTGDAWTFTDVTGNYNNASGTVNDAIAKANPTISVTGYSVMYDGNPHTATGTATGAKGETLSGLALTGTMHTNAGSYTDSWSFTDSTGNYNNASGTVSDSIAKANATISVTGYSVTYDGNAHTATGTATGVKGESLAGLDLSGTAHTNAGNYSDPWTFTDTTGNYNNASGTVSDSIGKANATISVTSYSVTYDGNAHTAAGSTNGVKGEALAGLNLSGTTHTNAGTYNGDAWSFTDTTGNYNNASGTVNDSISKANATISVTGYSVTYDGNAHTATGSATGAKGESLAGLSLAGTTHTTVGSYTDPWTFTDSTGNYNNASGTVSDSIAGSLSSTPANLTPPTASEGQALSGVTVFHFTDSNPNATISQYVATVNTGDATLTSSANPGNVTIVANGGGYDVRLSYTYAEELAGKTFSVSVTDAGGSHTSQSVSSFSVQDASLTGSALTISSSEGSAITSVTIATFTDADPQGAASDYSVSSINWGDGDTTASVSVVADSQVAGRFDVVASKSHAYADGGNYSVKVSVADAGGATVTVTSSAAVADPALSSTSANFSTKEGASFTGTVANFTDADTTDSVSSYTASINWGDGQISTGTVQTTGTAGQFHVQGTHVYQEAGSYTVKTTINDAGGSQTQASSTATVGDAALSGAAVNLSTVVNQQFNGVVATFTDANSFGQLSDFTATINWGNGKTTTGTVALNPNGGFEVMGSFTYTKTGNYNFTVTIHDKDGSSLSLRGKATVNGVAKVQPQSALSPELVDLVWSSSDNPANSDSIDPVTGLPRDR